MILPVTLAASAPILPAGAPAPAVAALVYGALGVPAGAAARRLLGRLRRGTAVAPPWCEAATAALWALGGAGWAGGLLATAWLPVVLGLGWFAVACTAVDLGVHRLPDALTLPALPVALLLLTPLGGAAVLRGCAGAALLAGAHAAVHLAAPRALGAGDVKLAASLGAVLAARSWAAVLLGALVAAMITGLFAVVVLVTRRLGRTDALAHGPAMVAACWLVVAGAG